MEETSSNYVNNPSWMQLETFTTNWKFLKKKNVFSEADGEISTAADTQILTFYTPYLSCWPVTFMQISLGDVRVPIKSNGGLWLGL